MRKLIVVIASITILMLALTGCGRALNKQTEPPAQQTGNTADQQAKSNESTAQAPDSSGSNQAGGSSAIIAKSGNIVSSSDKAELLSQVDKELDSLFNSTNNLDDVQDSDLNVNQ